MPFLITPIKVDGTQYCCQPETRRTQAILSGAARELALNSWEVYRATKDGPVKQGSVKFGVCCADKVDISLSGNIETLNSNFDWIEVLHNDSQVFRHASTSSSEDPDETIPAGPFLVSIDLDERPCGHIIEIRGSTEDTVANNGVVWQAEVSIG